MEQKIKRLIRYYTNLTGTSDPMTIANYAGIHVLICPLGNVVGNYRCIKRERWIFINETIDRDSPMFNVILAHELGHALLHRHKNCAFIRHHTLLLTSGIEREANLVAAYLLISDALIESFEGFTREQFCDCTGYPKELIELRMKDYV